MPERDVRERDILIASNEYAYVQDLTKGDIVLYVGPTKISLSNTERLVEYKAGRFSPIRSEDGSSGVSPLVFASSSQYILLDNPVKDSATRSVKGSNSASELLVGRRVVTPGPATFPLWPGQRAEVIDGHKLREDQYLVVRVTEKTEGDPSPIGAEHIVKGSEVSFYIPRTGLEVVPEKSGTYVRTAVTLRDGEYCILLSPDGRRRYHRGPAIVFPTPMEEFVQAGGKHVFKAWHLRRGMGLHVRVVKDFTVSADDQVPAGTYRAGQELFLQDREGFFFPTEDLEVVAEVLPVPISDKEGVYVRELASGRISTVVGPRAFLPDPTLVEVVTRGLDAGTASLYGVTGPSGKAISVYIPPSYAVLVTAKDRRDVVRGPQVRILGYDEDLEVLTLSTGRPKTDEKLIKTCYLQTHGNKVSDVIRVKTGDHVELDVLLSYRVSFAPLGGDASDERWFNVKNYVALLCDHLGSIVRAAVRVTAIEAFAAGSTEIIRSAILGERSPDGKRTGRRFEENGMVVYDVEVLDVRILDGDVAKLLTDAQRRAIVSELKRKDEEFRLRDEKLKEHVDQQVLEARVLTLGRERDLEGAARELAQARVQTTVEVDRIDRVGKAQNESAALEISSKARAEAGKREQEVAAQALAARVEAFQKEMAALHPELVATLVTLGGQQVSAELTKNLSPLAILGGQSVAEILERLLEALPVGIGGRVMGKKSSS